jgi:DNA-binding NarL/FixJ family response regulator
MSYRIVIADDQPLVRSYLREVLSEHGDFEVVAEAADGQMLLDLLEEGFFADLFIVDISMPRVEGIEAIRRLRNLRPETKTLVLTMHTEKHYLAHALAVGATGYLVKDNAALELISAIEKIRQGGTYVSSCLAKAAH